MTPPTKKVLLWIRSLEPGGHDVGQHNKVSACVVNGWAVHPSKDRHTLQPKVKGRREIVEDAVKKGTSDGVPNREVALANSLGGTVGVESPSRVG
jgi:hypothetical protein